MKLLLRITILLSMQFVFSQTKITGRLTTDKGKALANAKLYSKALNEETKTNEKGEFQITLPDNLDYTFVVSKDGYAYQPITLNSKESNYEIILNNDQYNQIDPVIISTPFHSLQSQNVVKVEKASIKNFQDQGAFTLAQAIEQIPGVETITTGIGIGKPIIRGLSYNRVVTYTQGIRLENQQFGDEHGLGISDAGVESVEVIKGPSSLLYGSDALGGVLYFNPERFAHAGETKGDVNLNYYTNTVGYNANAGIKTSTDHLKFLFRGSYTSHEDYETGGGVSVTNSRFKEYDLKGGIGYEKGIVKTALRYNFVSQEIGIPEELDEKASHSRKSDEAYQPLETHILSSQTDIALKNNSNINVTLGYVHNDRKEMEERGEDPELHMKLSTFNYAIKYALPHTKKLETILGAQGMIQNNKNSGEEFLIPDADVNDIGVFAVSHYHFNKDNVLQVGIRYDRRNIDTEKHEEDGEVQFESLDKDFNSFNASLGLKSNLSKDITARVNLASGFRAPNLAELTSNGQHEGTQRFEKGNQGLKTERNLQGDIDLEYKNEFLTIYLGAYYNHVNHYIFLQPTNDTEKDEDGKDIKVYNYAQNDAKLYGGEIRLNITPQPIGWLHFDNSFEAVTGKQNHHGDYLPFIPANKLKNTVRVEFNNHEQYISKKYAFVTLENVFDQNNPNSFEEKTPGYTLLNVGLGGKFKLYGTRYATLSISANNLLDKDYVSHLSRLEDEETGNRIGNIGRNISIGLRIPF